MANIRIATFNLYRGRPREQWHATLKKIAQLKIDVLLVQEAEKGTLRSPKTDHVADLARAMGHADHAFLPSKNRLTTLMGIAGEPGIGDKGQGIGLISKLPVSMWKIHHLQSTESLLRFSNGSIQVDQPRQLLAAVIDTDGGSLSVACTHLSWRPDSSKAQLNEACEVLSKLPGQHVLGGDFNQWKNRSRWDNLVEANTYPADKPDKHIDYLVGDVDTTGGETVRMPISDHLLLWTDVSTS